VEDKLFNKEQLDHRLERAGIRGKSQFLTKMLEELNKVKEEDWNDEFQMMDMYCLGKLSDIYNENGSLTFTSEDFAWIEHSLIVEMENSKGVCATNEQEEEIKKYYEKTKKIINKINRYLNNEKCKKTTKENDS